MCTACCRPENNGAMKKLSHKNVLFSKLETSLAPDSEDRVTIPHIDFAKAFDIVSHTKLYHKLQGYGISGNVLAWIQNFLTERTHCTRVGNCRSSTKYLTSGVVQGSCLGVGPMPSMRALNFNGLLVESLMIT